MTDKTCKSCHVAKPFNAFRRHNGNGYRGTCRECENAIVRETKPWQSPRKKKYQIELRQRKRGFALTNDAKRRAKDKDIPFDLDWHDIQRRIEAGICDVTGLPFSLDAPKSWNAPSLDQAEPGKGYTKENTRVVLYAVNTMANTWGVDLILLIGDAIRQKRIALGRSEATATPST